MSLRVVSARCRSGLVAAFLLPALLAPVVGAGAVLADDLADLMAPTDDPQTPGPDLYHGRSLDIPDMPDLVAMALPLPAPALAPPAPARERGIDGASRPGFHELVPGPGSRAPPGLDS